MHFVGLVVRGKQLSRRHLNAAGQPGGMQHWWHAIGASQSSSSSLELVSERSEQRRGALGSAQLVRLVSGLGAGGAGLVLQLLRAQVKLLNLLLQTCDLARVLPVLVPQLAQARGVGAVRLLQLSPCSAATARVWV